VVSVRQQIAAGVGWTALQKWIVRFAGILTFVVLSRLLTPSEIGLAALALAVVGALGVIADLGASTFLVQARTCDQATKSTVFWTALAGSGVAAGLLVLAAAPLTQLLQEPRLLPMVQALAPVLVLNALGAVPAAILQREMRFRAMAVRETAATIAAAVVGAGLAARGAGVWALVLQSLVQAAVSAVLVWQMSGWRPSWEVSWDALRELRRFSGPLLGVNMMQAVRDRLDQFLLGAVLGVHALGLWAVAVRLLTVLADVSVAVLDTVALPLFSASRESRERFQRVLESAMASAQVLLVPALVCLAVTSPVLIPWMFGSQWAAAVPPAQVLCLGYGIAGLAYFNRAALLSHGRSGVELALTGGFLVLHVTAVVLVAPLGLTALAWAGVAEACLTVVVGALILRATLGTRLHTLVRSFRVVVVGVLAAAAAVAVSEWTSGWSGQTTRLSASGAMALVVLAVGMYGTNRALLRDVVADVRGLATRRPAT
jgi:O-antigen/teichoic acid export membrane protein